MIKKIINRIIFISLIIIIFISCKTTTEPIVYDKNIDIIKKESQLVQILINNDNFEKAHEQIDKLLKLYPENESILELQGWLLLKEKKYNDSEKIFLSLLDKKNKNPHVYAGLARIYRITGNKEKALEYVNKGIAYLPTISVLWLEKGILEYENKEYKKAIINFNKAYSLDTKNYEAYFFKYITLLRLDRELDEIKHYWDKLIQDGNAKSWFYLYHADVLYDMDYKEYSLEVVKSGLINYPDDPYLLNMYSYYQYEKYLEIKDEKILVEAEENILKCIELSEKLNAGFIDTYLSILKAKGDDEKLEEEANKYFLLFPESDIMIKWIKFLNKKQ